MVCLIMLAMVVTVCSGEPSTFNQVIEEDLDALMNRTKTDLFSRKMSTATLLC
jgi:heme O synthase-like polyprenyltransferase